MIDYPKSETFEIETENGKVEMEKLSLTMEGVQKQSEGLTKYMESHTESVSKTLEAISNSVLSLQKVDNDNVNKLKDIQVEVDQLKESIPLVSSHLI